jgi:hypothetical protein
LLEFVPPYPRYRQLQQAQRIDAPIESVVGAVPTWAWAA